MDERHYLSPLFEPQSVAIIGATEREDALGAVLVRNMLESRYNGALFAVNPKHRSVQGVPCYRRINDIKQRIDLAVIATPAKTVPDVMAECGRAGARTVVVLSAGFGESGTSGARLEMEAMRTAKKYGMRVLGPNSFGITRPAVGLNATFAHGKAISGSIGFISQSGALCAAILDYARPNQVGFSNVVSLGVSSDLDFGEVLDYLVWDHRTESILLYIEAIRDARRFLSSLRAAARAKPVMVFKAGRHPAGLRAARSHIGAVAGDDAVFDAALRRAGVIRLNNLSQLYAASKALFVHFRPRGNRLAIITNGGGPGVMAADTAGDLGIPLAQLSMQTMTRLKKILPPHGSLDNPVDLISDSDPDRYAAALDALLNDQGVDGVLCLLAPQAMTKPLEVAHRVVELHKRTDKPILTCWLGDDSCLESREVFRVAGIPSLRTPETAVELFSHISAYYRNQQLLTQVPAPLEDEREPLVAAARLIIDTALLQRRTVLSREESMALFAAFHISTLPIQVGHSAEEGTENRHELMVRVWRDPVFGPVIGFGERSLDPNYWPDKVVSLPPLNAFLVNDFIKDTRAIARFSALDGSTVADVDEVKKLLLRISEIVCELPWVRALEINPLYVDARGAIVADARVEIGQTQSDAGPYDHMAIHPYPSTLVSAWQLKDGTPVVIRPIKPEDAALEQAFIRRLSPETKYFRFMNAVRELAPSLLAKLTQIDYDRELAFVATIIKDATQYEIGVCRYATNPDGASCEFAIVVADEFQGSGVGRKLMQVLIDTARSRGLKTMKGTFLVSNDRMLRFVEKFGFLISNDPDDRSIKVGMLDLTSSTSGLPPSRE